MKHIKRINELFSISKKSNFEDNDIAKNIISNFDKVSNININNTRKEDYNEVDYTFMYKNIKYILQNSSEIIPLHRNNVLICLYNKSSIKLNISYNLLQKILVLIKTEIGNREKSKTKSIKNDIRKTL